ncbi:MHS family MFS transporter [Nocardia farcinica]|uniref:MFS transporter n=1 Tax=Nocardia farcinica TaxID=37329 RepID=UPI0018945323|nr:MFS transporter [Nocardia farcinica]MBF6143119.1 MHS family MFS transporter [Nocardia farcinica]MBF6387759.1 MHS family MFS transporter [Nocardia farcinica]
MNPAVTPHSDPALRRRVAVSSLLGTAIEYYDFLLYSTMTALVFNKVFFPDSNPALGTIAAFGTLAAGYVARPIGGVLFGHFGDRIGRKSMLVLTMLLMGASSFLIGVLPTYAGVGILAPLLLVLLRVVQGVAIGGEWGGATLMVTEHAEPGRRGFWNGIMQMGSPIGSLLSTGVVAVVALLPEEDLLSWGWRIPFLASIVLLAAGVYLRIGVTESPVFQAAAAEAEPAPRIPFVAILQRPATLLLACGIGIGPFALTALLSTYMISYATNIGYDRSSTVNGLLFVSTTAFIAIPLFSALSDRVGRRPVVLGGAIGIVILAWPIYTMVDSGSVPLLFAAMVLGQCAQSAMFAPLGALLSEMFGTAVRYTGASMGYQFAALLGGGFTPLVASALLVGGPDSTPLILLAVGCGLVTVLCISRVRETRGADLHRAVTGAAVRHRPAGSVGRGFRSLK